MILISRIPLTVIRSANPKTRRQTIDDLLQQAGHIAEGSSDGQTGEMVEAGVATLANTVPVIMDVLDAVATIHPAIKGNLYPFCRLIVCLTSRSCRRRRPGCL